MVGHRVVPYRVRLRGMAPLSWEPVKFMCRVRKWEDTKLRMEDTKLRNGRSEAPNGRSEATKWKIRNKGFPVWKEYK